LIPYFVKVCVRPPAAAGKVAFLPNVQGPLCSQCNGFRGVFLWGTVAWTWSWSFTV